MSKKFLIFVLAILFAFLLAVIGFVVYPYFQAKTPVKYVDISNINRTAVGEKQISYVLYNVKANELHKIPLSGNTPKIEVVIDDEIYSSEIVEGMIITIKSRIEDPDLRIIMSEEEFINSLNSDTKAYLQKSVSQGRIDIEVLAGKTELFAKGYLSLYKKLTGENPLL